VCSSRRQISPLPLTDESLRHHNGCKTVEKRFRIASLTLKNLPDVLLRDLRKAAEEDRRSLTQEIIHLLDAALRGRLARASFRRADVEAQLAAWRKLAGKWESQADRTTEAARLMGRRTPGRKVAF